MIEDNDRRLDRIIADMERILGYPIAGKSRDEVGYLMDQGLTLKRLKRGVGKNPTTTDRSSDECLQGDTPDEEMTEPEFKSLIYVASDDVKRSR